ncbi:MULTISPECIES: acyl-CoA dehydrogenase [Pseudomonas]|uniref:Acyl-coenzyme A dehydrogenase n=1 Tax=Pseudomonas gingeri TaxID=117681 RepID=A0A7Y8BQH6_9PSED|nr:MULTISPECIES: acyl-CoA dehydrogenase [Pseudomonas]NWB83672.1 acyl-CoA dehydrogenase [Pseudomonas gingeri]RBH53828.1 acyl-CoA dehydrogenase [Pseudomonas sp. MWU13-2860]
MTFWLLLAVAGALALGYRQASARLWLAGVLVWLAGGYLFGVVGPLGTAIGALLLLVPAMVLAVRPLRRALLSRRALVLFRQIMPAMSDTERAAIESGTVWWDAELFSGKPRWQRLLGAAPARLSAQEQAFLDNEVETLCDMANDWETTQVWQDLSPQAWQYTKEAGFLGMIIPRQYGGKGFSHYAHSQVVMKLSTRCSAAAISVMVPNSLGPAELLLHYGTEAQRQYYLPRLARGEDIPCFALTSPYAGSDAGAIPDLGVVCKGTFEGQEVLGFSVTWDKRYITLGPIATVLGLAFRAEDPDGLLGSPGSLGITCALIPTSHPGVQHGRRHWPLNAVFQNGPTQGKDVFIPLEWVIGGREQVGNGWRMLMECLAAGRAISLPSANVGLGKVAVRGTTAYAAMRKQFGLPIGKFEGVQAPLARMAGHLYACDAVRKVSVAALDAGEKPSVISAIAKYHVTERARAIVNDGMDIAAGKGICMGPNNFLARAYQQSPIAITVEGANIMTRCLIIYGQGLIRCHPYVLREMEAARRQGPEGLEAFDRAMFGHIGFVLANTVRAAVHGLTAGRLLKAPVKTDPALAPYYRQIERLSVVLALVSDISMGVLGGALKRKESITGRLGDILSQLYILSCVLKRFEDDGRPRADLPLVHWAAQDALWRAHEALSETLDNYPSKAASRVIRGLAFPFGIVLRKPSDRLLAEVAELVQTPGESRDRLLADSYMPQPDIDKLAYGELAFRLQPQVDLIEAHLKPAVRQGLLAPLPISREAFAPWRTQALAAQLISGEEGELLGRYVEYADHAIQVDDFPQDFGLLEALQRRQAHIDQADKSLGKRRVAAGNPV